MADYRLYWLDGAGKIDVAEWLDAEDDDGATRNAEQRADGRACEIWERNRLVAKVAPSAA